MVCSIGFGSRLYQTMTTNHRFVGAAGYWAVPTNQFLEITKKGQKIAIFFNPRRSPPAATHPLYGCSIFSQFLHTLRRPGFEPATSLSRTISSTTTPNIHLCPQSILIPHVLYKNEYKLIVWGPKLIQMKSCQLQSFITFQDLQLWYWSFLHPRSFEEFEFQK